MEKNGIESPDIEKKRPVLDVVYYSSKDKGEIRRNVGGCWDNDDETFKVELKFALTPERLTVFPRDDYAIPWLNDEVVEEITGGSNKPVCDLFVSYTRTNELTGQTRKSWWTTVAGGYRTPDGLGISFDFPMPVSFADAYIRRRKTPAEIDEAFDKEENT